MKIRGIIVTSENVKFTDTMHGILHYPIFLENPSYETLIQVIEQTYIVLKSSIIDAKIITFDTSIYLSGRNVKIKFH